MFTSIKYFLSVFIWSVANPFGLRQSIYQVGGQVAALLRWLLQTDRATVEEILFSLPFESQWMAVNGGVKPRASHSWGLIAQRYAYDFLITGPDGTTHTGAGRQLSDYRAFNQPVLAPAEGTVVEVRADIADYANPGSGWVDWSTRDIRGNYVVIRHGERLYSLLAHLKQGSCLVKVGDEVDRGQALGRCGNSGHAFEPHLHFQLQDHPDFHLAVGLPVRFAGFVRSGTGQATEAVAAGYVRKGQQLRPARPEEVPEIDEEPVAPRVGFGDLVLSLVTMGLTVFGFAVIFGEIISFLLGALGALLG